MKKALLLVLALLATISMFGCSKSESDKDDTHLNSESSSTTSSQIEQTTSSQIEKDKDIVESSTNTVDNNSELSAKWEYSLKDNEIILTKYIGEDDKITVEPVYNIEDKEYKTVLSESTQESGVFNSNDKIKSVIISEGVGLPENKAYMFKDCINLTYTNADYILSTPTSSTKEMFSGCIKLSALDISTLDTSSLQDSTGMFNDCSSASLILVKNNKSKHDISDKSNLSNRCIIAENMDKSIWEYEFDKSTGVLNLTKYKGSGRADPCDTYSIDGRLYNNITYGKTQSTESKPSNTKPSTNNKPNTNSKPSTSSKPNTSTSSQPTTSSKPSNDTQKNEKIYYTVTFNTGKGSKINDQKILKGEKAKEPRNPTNDYYKFYGWYTSKSYKTKYDFDDEVNSNITLYARWEDTDYIYEVEHYKQNGDRDTYKLADTETFYTLENTTVTAKAKSYSGYTENKSHPDRVYRDKVTDDNYVVLRLYYDKDTFTAKFNSNGGTSVNSQTVSKKSKYKEIIPRKKDATFEGWYLDSKFTELYDFDDEVRDITLYAKWKENKTDYKVEHYREDLNGNYKLFETEKLSGDTDSIVVAKPKSYEGYSENTSHSDRVESIRLTEDNTILKLYYSLHEFTVSFDSDEGSEVSDQIVKYGAKVKIEKPTKEGFNFKGWYTDTGLNNEFDKNTKVSENITLYAKWEQIE